MNPRDASTPSDTNPKAQDPPLWTALRGGVENFQLDRSCALILLAGAAMAVFGVVAALVIGAVRDVDLTWLVLFFVGVAALSALVGAWIWRRSRRLGVRPLGLRTVAIANLVFAVPFFATRALTWGYDDLWRAGVDLLFLGTWVLWAVAFWRMGGGQRRKGDPSPTEETSTPP